MFFTMGMIKWSLQPNPMTTAPNTDPTLQDVSNDLQDLANKLDKLTAENERFNDKFDNYQKATQWVVQLAFTLIASATITVIITSILRK